MDDRYGIPLRESESVEFKLSMAELTKAIRSGCAMLNSIGGGSVYIGVRDNGEIVGIEIGDRTHNRLNAELNKITPDMRPSVSTIPVDTDRYVLRLSFPGNTGPYRFDGRPYVRISASDHEMSEHDYHRMVIERLHGTHRWELGSALIGIDDLDTGRIHATVDAAILNGRLNDPGHRDTAGLLRGFGLIENGHITHAAAVLFGKPDALMRRYPQCQVKLARFEGTTKSQFRDNRQYYGNVFDLLRISSGFVTEHNPISSQILESSIQRRDTPTYHPRIVREALVNAFAHRDYAEGGGSVDVAIYDDRLEITSTGGLRFGLTVEDLVIQHPSRPWNENIARVLRWEGSFENWGTGTNRMLEIAREAGLPLPDFLNSRLAFTVCMHRPESKTPIDTNQMTNIEPKVVALLSEYGSLTLSEIADLLPEVSDIRRLQRDLQRLRSTGAIDVEGQRRWARWKLPKAH